MSSKARATNAVVADLRRLSKEVAAMPGPSASKDGMIYFPPKEFRGDGVQPVELSGYVSARSVGELLHYVADMLEE